MKKIAVVVAHPRESASIVTALGMEPRGTSPFRSFQGDHADLVLSGQGGVSCAAALGWLAAQNDYLGWINAGVCGHGRAGLGCIYWMGKVTDDRQSWYPQRIFSNPWETGTLRTGQVRITDYPDDHCVDMEGAAFCAAASRFVTGEWMHVLKVVSDNTQYQDTQRNLADGLLDGLGPAVGLLVGKLREQADHLPRGCPNISPINKDSFPDRLYATHSQRQQLRQLQESYAALGLPDPLGKQTAHQNARGLIADLQQRLRDFALEYPLGKPS